MQLTEREAIEVQTQLLAFDRQNHMGASDNLAKSLKKAIKEEAEAMLNEKKVASSAVNIQENANKMKVMSPKSLYIAVSRTLWRCVLCSVKA